MCKLRSSLEHAIALFFFFFRISDSSPYSHSLIEAEGFTILSLYTTSQHEGGVGVQTRQLNGLTTGLASTYSVHSLTSAQCIKTGIEI